jgi:hypothetical protein
MVVIPLVLADWEHDAPMSPAARATTTASRPIEQVSASALKG